MIPTNDENNLSFWGCEQNFASFFRIEKINSRQKIGHSFDDLFHQFRLYLDVFIPSGGFHPFLEVSIEYKVHDLLFEVLQREQVGIVEQCG